MEGRALGWRKFFIFLAVLFLFVPDSFAIMLLMKNEALRRLYPDAESITEELVTADEQQINAIKGGLGGTLTHVSAKNNSAVVDAINKQKNFVFYYAFKNQEKIGVALILDEPGAWGNVKFIVSLSLIGGINSIAVMEYKEIRGRPIASNSFLVQFRGKTLKDKISLGSDIVGISGATGSSQAACFAAKKAMVLYKELVLKK